MAIKEQILNIIPARYELAARYHFDRILGEMEEEIDIIDAITVHRRVAIDVGASVGLYTYRLAGLFDAVYAFEPIPSQADVISKSRMKNVFVFRNALSDSFGLADLSVPGVGGPEEKCLASLSNKFDGGKSMSVVVMPLDAYQFEVVDFIKIAVEGHELNVIEGAHDTIERFRPTLLIEIEQRHHRTPIEHIFQTIEALGYKGEFLDPQFGLEPLMAFNVAHHQRGDPMARGYINNFVFRPIKRPFVP